MNVRFGQIYTQNLDLATELPLTHGLTSAIKLMNEKKSPMEQEFENKGFDVFVQMKKAEFPEVSLEMHLVPSALSRQGEAERKKALQELTLPATFSDVPSIQHTNLTIQQLTGSRLDMMMTDLCKKLALAFLHAQDHLTRFNDYPEQPNPRMQDIIAGKMQTALQYGLSRPVAEQ